MRDKADNWSGMPKDERETNQCVPLLPPWVCSTDRDGLGRQLVEVQADEKRCTYTQSMPSPSSSLGTVCTYRDGLGWQHVEVLLQRATRHLLQVNVNLWGEGRREGGKGGMCEGDIARHQQLLQVNVKLRGGGTSEGGKGGGTWQGINTCCRQVNVHLQATREKTIE